MDTTYARSGPDFGVAGVAPCRAEGLRIAPLPANAFASKTDPASAPGVALKVAEGARQAARSCMSAEGVVRWCGCYAFTAASMAVMSIFICCIMAAMALAEMFLSAFVVSSVRRLG